MEILTRNYPETTTSISVVNNTLAAENLLDRDINLQYFTSGLNDDATTASITFTFDETLPVSRIALLGINCREFNIFFNGSTSNTFALSGGNTTTSQWSSNSESSLFLRCTEVDISSITIDMKATMVPDSEKAIGYFYVGDLQIDFPRLPSANDYKPQNVPKEVVHTMSDGGKRLHRISRKFAVSLKLKNITHSFREELKSLYNRHEAFVFVPFGTDAAWDGILHEVIWAGPFNFDEYAENNPSAGFDGSIKLEETTR